MSNPDLFLGVHVARSKLKSNPWLNGVVHWFDRQSGEGMIKADTGQLFFVHQSAIDSEKKNRTLKDRQRVRFQLIDDVTFVQVSRVREL